MAGAADAELHRGEPALLARIDDGSPGMWSSQDYAAVPVYSLRARKVVSSELVFGEVDHQVSLAVWHDSFQPERNVHFVVMERFDKSCQNG